MVRRRQDQLRQLAPDYNEPFEELWKRSLKGRVGGLDDEIVDRAICVGRYARFYHGMRRVPDRKFPAPRPRELSASPPPRGGAPQAHEDSDTELDETAEPAVEEEEEDEEDFRFRAAVIESVRTAAEEEEGRRRATREAICGVCLEPPKDPIRVSFCCDHEFCSGCVSDMLRVKGPELVRCPACGPEHKVLPLFVPARAARLIDPHFVSGLAGAEDALKNSDQLKNFMPEGVVAGFFAVCCKCGSLAVPVGGGVAIRCARGECGTLCCAACNKPWHGGKACVSDSDGAALISSSVSCPGCGALVVHYRGHGCHSMTCTKCRRLFCYICRAGRCTCPVYCGDRCRCPVCPDCVPGSPCHACRGDCPKCRNT